METCLIQYHQIHGFGLATGLYNPSLHNILPQLTRRHSPWNAGEGPASGSDYNLPQAILSALIPDASQRSSVTTQQQPPSDFNPAFTSQEAFEAALDNLRNNTDPVRI